MTRRAAALCLAALAGSAPAARAQGTWDAQLAIAAFPSPYLSDWEANPTIGTLTITNPGADQDVVLAYRVTSGGGRLLASGRSNPVLIPRGVPTVITDIVNISGSSQHDQSLEQQMRRTGRLPEGDNTTCVAVTDTGGFVLAEDCATFSIVYPDPPYLVGPLDEAALASGYPIFQWTPMQVPPAFQLTYVVRISEVLTGQTALQALTANIPVFTATTAGTSLEYPLGGMPLVQGKTYAWRVQALDQNGYPASSNDGRSEVWTFGYQPEGVVPVEGPDNPVSLGITFFDPEGPLPEIWQMLDTASFAGFINYLAAQARSGRLELPMPMPSVLADAVGGTGGVPAFGGGGGAQGSAPGGAWVRRTCASPGSGPLLNLPLLAGLHALVTGASASGGNYSDPENRATFVLEGEASLDVLNPLLACLGVENTDLPPLGDARIQLAVWKGPAGGLPRITLGIKLRAFPHQDRGLVFKHAVFVVNLLGDFVISPRELPPSPAMQEFYGPYSFEVWGTGIIDLLTGVAGARKDAWKLWQAMPGLNFFGVLDLRVFHAIAEGIGFTPLADSMIVQGFAGFREKTYRQVSFGGDGSGRAGRKVRDVWYVRGSVGLRSFGVMPGVESRHLVVEYGRRDVSAPHAMPAYGDTTAMPSRYRLAVRIVLGGFQDLKPYLGVHPDSTLAFFAELQGERTVQPTPTSRPRSNAIGDINDPALDPPAGAGRQRSNAVTSPTEVPANRVPGDSSPTEMSITFGTDATFQVGPLYFHDVKATWLMTSRTFRLTTDWGFDAGSVVGGFERVGVLSIEPYLTPPPRTGGEPPCDECERLRHQLRTAREAQADAWRAVEREREWVVDVGRTEDYDVALERARELDFEVYRLNDLLENQEARNAAGTGGRRRLRFKVTIGLDQGATIAELLGRAVTFAQWLGSN